MGEARRRFHEELRALEDEVQRTGTQAQRLLEQALQALTHRDLTLCEAVIRGDDEVDQLYLDIERRILGLFALQTPVASDLRLLTALLHINLHQDRIADQVVAPDNAEVLASLLPDARLQRFDGAGHLLYWEQPKRFVRAVTDFLTDPDPAVRAPATAGRRAS